MQKTREGRERFIFYNSIQGKEQPPEKAKCIPIAKPYLEADGVVNGSFMPFEPRLHQDLVIHLKLSEVAFQLLSWNRRGPPGGQRVAAAQALPAPWAPWAPGPAAVHLAEPQSHLPLVLRTFSLLCCLSYPQNLEAEA